MYAEVILPLPIPSAFTYSVPDSMTEDISVGARVLVQFGSRKSYTGIVRSIVDSVNIAYEIKPVVALLDGSPVVRYPQLKLWEWIASYYLCAPGEVMRAAIPAGLKPESETFVSLAADWEVDREHPLTEKQALVVSLLDSARKKMQISDIEKESSVKGVPKVVNELLERGILNVSEKLVEKYTPKSVKRVRLTFGRESMERLHDAMEAVHRSPRQEKALIAYLDLSRFMARNEPLLPVDRETLVSPAYGVTPGVLKSLCDKGILEVYKEKVNRFGVCEGGDVRPLPELSEAQRCAMKEIVASFRDHDTVLLRGVTGSGKTEIYSHLIRQCLDAGDQVLYLVPEISLTTQLTDRLRKYFGEKLVVYHSRFSDNERVDIWRQLLESKDPLVILGARSSLFLPFARLGLVIVDEEHESSYKQYDPAPRYNARDTAIVLASMHGAKTLLGSATPSVETYWKALSGKFGLVKLLERYEGVSLPEVCIVDMKDQWKKKINTGIISRCLKEAVAEELAAGNQAIMFQNRRGFSPMVICRQCGWVPKCDNCDVSLVYHKNTRELRCHYCGFTRQLPTLCPACGLNDIEVFGYGTERIAEELHEVFPGNRVARMDLDTTRNKNSYQEIIEDFSNKDTDILVGTQMVSKGLDFGKVKVVGVLNADTMLNFPDFRSNERAFNMLEQVSGRAGRREGGGRVFIQTRRPDDEVLGFVKEHDYEGFYRQEIEDRKRYAYPPFTKVINITLRNKDSASADYAAVLFSNALRNVFGTRVLGPEKPFVSRVANWYLQSIMLKVESQASMVKVKDLLQRIYASIASDPRIKSSRISYDVDPA